MGIINIGNFALIDRKLELSDIHSLVQFDIDEEFTHNLDTPTDHRPDPFTDIEFRDVITNNEFIFHGLFDNSKLIAFYQFESKKETKEMYIYSIIIHHNYRDHGISKYILNLADIEAQKLGFDKCALTVDPLNGRGVYSYFKNGYFIVDYKLNHYGPNIHRFIMEKKLTNSIKLPIIETKTILVSDDEGLVNIIRDGFIGVSLTRGDDNRHNKITFIKI